jgi:phenylalanyl-tRNA synthetase alpha chain
MENQIEELKKEFRLELETAGSLEAIETLRIKYFGKKGSFTVLLREIGNIPEEQRKDIGKVINEASNEANVLFEERKLKVLEMLEESSMKKESVDITLPGKKFKLGRDHPVSQVMDEAKEIFVSMGFRLVDGPEVETIYYNFKALNIPDNHPARDMWNTFYIDDDILLRTHTSPVQIRVMEKNTPPIAIIAPGKCYRRDAIDASHSPMFHQIEGLLVDRNITFSNLKAVLEVFVKRMFGDSAKLRFRPSFFPFTEPSAEVDIQCVVCKGAGCSLCKKTGWLEIMGAGMVRPEVFKYVNYDPEEFKGFAFGMGIERIAILKLGIDDIRLFFENDMRFLEQF